MARLELRTTDGNALIEAHLPALQFRALGVAEGDAVIARPKLARVFVEAA